MLILGEVADMSFLLMLLLLVFLCIVSAFLCALALKRGFLIDHE